MIFSKFVTNFMSIMMHLIKKSKNVFGDVTGASSK